MRHVTMELFKDINGQRVMETFTVVTPSHFQSGIKVLESSDGEFLVLCSCSDHEKRVFSTLEEALLCCETLCNPWAKGKRNEIWRNL